MGTFSNYESALSAEKIASAVGALQRTEVNLTLPRFKTTGAFELDQILSELGMPTAFTAGEADFSGMDGRKDLFIGFVVHQAYVDVSEQGTEAAAATAGGMNLTVAPSEPTIMTVDRPFFFIIRDVETGSILFFGRILDPSDAGE